MMTQNQSKLVAENKLIFAIPMFLLTLTLANLFSMTANAQESNHPKGWSFNINQLDYKAGLDQQVSQHGQNSVTIESIAERPKDYCTLMQTLITKAYANKRIKMTGFIKSLGLSDTASMWLRVDDIGNKIFADFDNMMDRPVVGNKDWTKCEIIFDVPENCLIVYGFIFKGAGKVWVDNVYFETVNSNVSKTAQSLNQPFPEQYLNQIKEAPKDLPEKPSINLDFEEITTATPSKTVATDLPRVDLHVHISQKFGSPAPRYEKAAALSSQLGVIFGIAEEIETPDIKTNDNFLIERSNEIKKYPLYLGLQVNQPGWTKLYSKKVIDNLDYILADALRFPDKNGKVRLLWTQGVVFDDPEDFMDRYVDYNLKVLSEPIQIWVNATFLPASIANTYDKLWTEKRMKILIDAAVKNNVAIEINSRYQIPSKKFILMAKAAGAHFTFGSNQHDIGIGDINWSISMANECGLKTQDFFTPKRKLMTK